MAKVFVSIGSNVQRNTNIKFCLAQLKSLYSGLEISSVYENEAVGFDGDPFYNLVAAFETDNELPVLLARLREIEDQAGRDRTQPRFSPRTLDIDILLYDDLVIADEIIQIPRDEITRYAFVLKPLSELCPECVHPVVHKSYRQLWQDFKLSSKIADVLVKVELN